MSLPSIGFFSFNAFANYVASFYVFEKIFQSVLKMKSLGVFSDTAFTGRATHQCLDITHYFLGVTLFLSPIFQLSDRSRIAASILILPVPLFCKAICQMASSGSATYRFSDSVIQVSRVSVKLGFVIAFIKTIRFKEPVGVQLLEVVKAAGFITAFVLDAFKTFEYLISADPKDFYLHLRWSQ
ncbi:MAG TPA: hypothetical protein VFU89_03750 [Rhabdochlamydiaceae bacterium]|nr:hypothetical protein [Rhabdochlamydiaceae bacterium]